MTFFRSAYSWISTGVAVAACVLWLAFTRTDEIAAFVFQIKPGGVIVDMTFVFKVRAAVWAGGVLVAFSALALSFLVRRVPISGYSREAFWYLVSMYAALALIFFTIRTSADRVTPSVWITWAIFAFYSFLNFFARRKKERGAPPPLPRSR